MNRQKENNQFLASGKIEDYLSYRQEKGYHILGQQNGMDGSALWEMKQ